MSDTIDRRSYDIVATDWVDSLTEMRQSTRAELLASPEALKGESKLTALTDLASVNIETSMVSDLSGSLHSLFDDVCDKTLPIYFGPLLGRLYLEGL